MRSCSRPPMRTTSWRPGCSTTAPIPTPPRRAITALHQVSWVRKAGIAGSNNPAPQGSGTMDSLTFVRTLGREGRHTRRSRDEEAEHGCDDAQLDRRDTVPACRPHCRRAAHEVAGRARGQSASHQRGWIDAVDGRRRPRAPMPLARIPAPSRRCSTRSRSRSISATISTPSTRTARRPCTGPPTSTCRRSCTTWPTKGARADVWNRPNSKGWTPLKIAEGVQRGMNIVSSPATATAIREVVTGTP